MGHGFASNHRLLVHGVATDRLPRWWAHKHRRGVTRPIVPVHTRTCRWWLVAARALHELASLRRKRLKRLDSLILPVSGTRARALSFEGGRARGAMATSFPRRRLRAPAPAWTASRPGQRKAERGRGTTRLLFGRAAQVPRGRKREDAISNFHVPPALAWLDPEGARFIRSLLDPALPCPRVDRHRIMPSDGSSSTLPHPPLSTLDGWMDRVPSQSLSYSYGNFWANWETSTLQRCLRTRNL